MPHSARRRICPQANPWGGELHNWVKKYGNYFDAFNKKQIPKLSGKINTDEFVFKVKKK